MAKGWKRLVCKMKGCEGTVYRRKKIMLQTGCDAYSLFYACRKCGRVHSQNGEIIFNRPGAAVYFLNGKIEHILEPISFEIGKTYTSPGYLYICLEDEKEDGMPRMVDLGPETPLIFDGMGEDAMFRFHDELGTKYLLHRGDVNYIEEKK